MPRLAPGLLCLLASLAFLLPAGAVHAEDDPYAEAKKAYLAWQERPSLFMRHKGRVEFAQTGDVRALEILAKLYAKPEVPKDQVQYLLASLCAEHFRAPPHLETWRAWRTKHAKAQDAWLWYRALGVDMHIDGTAETVAVARTHRDGLMRVAALEALLAGGDEAALTIAAEWLAALPSKPFDRMLLMEATAQALYHFRAQHATDAWKKAWALLEPELDARTTPERTRLVVARRLSGVPGALEEAKRERYAPPVKPTFLGIEAAGHRVVYVIDMSDSMLTPLTKDEVQDLRRPPHQVVGPKTPVVTGGKDDGAPAPGPTPQEKQAADAILALPWKSIRTRFDAAREFLKLSLRALAPQQEFCVIGFGTDAKPLEATPGLRRATEAHVEKACVELDRIEPGKPTRDRPHGTLWGYTNVHGGMHRAFKVAGKGLVKVHEYVDPATFEEGCDTIFLLSDGQATWDDWPEWDRRLEKHRSGDPESGAEVEDQPMGHYYGPYALGSWLRDDLQRLELFRRAELHCIGIGEYDPYLLQWVAALGLGRFRQVGKAP
ncbi:MAG: hypothetical protein O2894_03490 [Planctomycetota bacterium]|nr:hypothetical protein [Planctomycetota bacterium]